MPCDIVGTTQGAEINYSDQNRIIQDQIHNNLLMNDNSNEGSRAYPNTPERGIAIDHQFGKQLMYFPPVTFPGGIEI